ncbi:glycoside hydrolase family 15 protein [Nonomuraea insulae]|uniref:Glycoside hydrolase family 15 protein n=1 Tax=Nonomuraea insulae TaxID=1616787 RepID=A0ABW1CNU5_9ACTN
MGDALPGYLPIAEHGIIGDLHTVALVGTDGTIDWYCCPAIDAPSVFAAILDRARGGYYRIAPAAEGWTTKQLYMPDTNVLITRFLSQEGVGEVQDFMPIEPLNGQAHRHRLIRRVLAVRGQMRFRLEARPRFNYGRDRHETFFHENGVLFKAPGISLALESQLPLRADGRDVGCEFVLEPGQSVTFVLQRVPESYIPRSYSDDETRLAFESTVRYWRNWLSRSRYQGRWREMVHRSALTLKLMTYAPTGAIVAAATTSLPEMIGGVRNWDYRYTWIRDAAFSLYALLRLGFTEEAAAFMGWLTERFQESRSLSGRPLQIMYDVRGGIDLKEEVLGHLEGYRGSAPVRIGNNAAHQLQLDIYGELIDSVYLYNKYGSPIHHDTWSDLCRSIEWIVENWDQADEGIWEVRGGSRHFTYSRMMSWVAIERAIRIATQRGLPADMSRWRSARDTIYHQVMGKGWNAGRAAFVQHYDTHILDASILIMPLVKFISPTDPRWLSTLDAIGGELVSDSLVYRYHVADAADGLDGSEGTFSICTFWYVEALAKAGRLDEARLVFEKMLTYANHLGLYSEEIGPTGEALGNFPQAFTHLALISAAYCLDQLLG